jgi:hypothetical protein
MYIKNDFKEIAQPCSLTKSSIQVNNLNLSVYSDGGISLTTGGEFMGTLTDLIEAIYVCAGDVLEEQQDAD